MLCVPFAIPGDLSTPTGGYAYARRLMQAGPGAGLDLHHVPLPDGFPEPDATALAQTAQTLGALPADTLLLIDGLAYGALPAEVIDQIRAPIVALCHHPLALETGVATDTAERLRALETHALAKARHVITTSKATADIVTRDFAVPGEKLTVAPPGTDAASRAQGSGGPGVRVLSVGSITPRKGHRGLVQSLAQDLDHDWHLRIVGPARDPQELAALRADIDALGLTDRVTLTGPLDAEALAQEYLHADLFALRSEFEGYGMAFTEAVSHGLPTIGLTSAAVEEATCGGAVLTRGAEFSTLMIKAIADVSFRAALAQKAWKSAQDLPRWPQTAQIVADVLREMKR